MNYAKILLAWVILATGIAANAEDKPTQRVEAENSQRLLQVVAEGEVTLIFLDALCPMPHFPGCEDFLQSINEYAPNKGATTYAVFNTLYVDEATVNDFAQKHNIVFPIIIDGDMSLHDEYGVYATPYVISLNAGQVTERGNRITQLTDKDE